MRIASCDRVIAAPVEVVWQLLTTPDGLNRWMSVEAEVDLRAGGTIRWRHDNGWVVSGEFQEIVPPRRLAFTYGWEEGGFPVPLGSSLVTIDLVSTGTGTEVRVRHTGLTEAMAEQHDHGWVMFLRRLAERAEQETTT